MSAALSLLTLNCFGGYLPSTPRRLLAIAHQLEHRSEHIVCLQEIQLNYYLRLFHQACVSFPYQAHEPYIQCPKGGLLTLARIPIIKKQFIPYEERGLWYTPMIMDKLLYKGMLVTILEWESIPVVIVNTHLLANYVGDWRRGMYARIEARQLQQLAELVRSQAPQALIIVAGDFNIPRGSSLYKDFMARSGLHDPLAGDTRPTHRPPLGIPAQYSLPLDYILVKIPATLSLTVECDICLSDKSWLSGRRFDYFSDHNGICARITKP